MIFWLITPVFRVFWHYTALLVNLLVHLLLLLTFAFALFYRLGWCHRFLWSLLEEMATNALNGTKVTIGSFSMDWLRGHWVLHNVIVHSPSRHVYHWESPVLARMGRVRVEFNPLWCLFSMLVLRDKDAPALDVNLLHMADIQCFLERKDHVFNVYLLDKLFVPPETPTASEGGGGGGDDADEDKKQQGDNSNNDDFMENKEPDLQMSNSSFGNDPDDPSAPNAATSTNPENAGEADRAEAVVEEMLKAVQSLGRAVQEGQLPQVLQEQRQRITQGLKDFNAQQTSVTQGLTLMQQVSKKVVEKSHKAVTQSNLILQAPKRQAPPPDAKIILARFGRVILDDLRVFTRTTVHVVVEEQQQQSQQQAQPQSQQQSHPHSDAGSAIEEEGVEVQADASSANEQQDAMTSTTTVSWVEEGRTAQTGASAAAASSSSMKRSNSAMTTNSNNTTATTTAATSNKQKKSYWNKPIKVDRVAVRASEFGAPMSAKDEHGFPVLFQPLEKSTDAIFKRIIGDMAKSNTGRLVRTAMGEVLDFYIEKEYQEEKN